MKSLSRSLCLVLSGLTASVATSAVADDIHHHEAMELMEQGAIRSFKDLGNIALGLHPDAIIVDTELEHEYGRYVYQVELRDIDTGEWDVYIDAATGEVIKNERDD